MAKVPISIFIDTTKDKRNSLVRSIDYNSPDNFQALAFGEVVDLNVTLVSNGTVDPLSGDSSVSMSVDIWDNTNGLLAVQPLLNNDPVSSSFYGSMSLATTNIQTALNGQRWINTNIEFYTFIPSTNEYRLMCQKPLTIYNTSYSSSLSSVTSSGYYTKDQVDAKFITYDTFASSSASVQAGNGVVVDLVNRVNVMTNSPYTPNALVFCEGTGSLSTSPKLVYNHVALQSQLSIQGDISQSGDWYGRNLNSVGLATLANAYVDSLDAPHFTASLAKTASVAKALNGPVLNDSGQTIATFDGTSPYAYATASVKSVVSLIGDPTLNGAYKPTLNWQSVVAGFPAASMMLDGPASGAVDLHLTAIPNGTVTVNRFRCDIPFTASTLSGDTTYTNTIGVQAGSTLKVNAGLVIGQNATAAPNANVTISGSVLPNDPSQSDLGSPAYHWRTVYADTFSGSVTNAATSSYFNGTTIGTSFWMKGQKSINLNTTGWTTGPTITLNDNQSVYFRATIHGNWTNVGPVGYTVDGVITKGTVSDATSQPGIKFREDNYNKDGRLIACQIADPGLVSGNANFPLQFSCSYSSIGSAVVIYEIQGQYVSVS